MAASPPAASSPLDRGRRLLSGNLDAVLLLLIVGVAAALRLWQLDGIPSGLHGDEAWTGLDARRVQNEGWIGPYVHSAHGQPAGPLYWTAAVLSVLGDSIFSLRFSMAVLGIATIPAVYFAGRMMFDRPTALIAATLLALLNWHLHFSRIAFMVISWPLVECLTLGLIFLAMRRSNDLRLWALAGGMLGLGMYTYNVYPLFVVIVGIFAVIQVAIAGRKRIETAKRFAVLFACSALTALPMLLFIAEPKNNYFGHHKTFSILRSEPFEQADTGGKIKILRHETDVWLGQIFWDAQQDGADGSGLRPMLDKLSIALLVAGVVICVTRIRDGPAQILLLLLLISPIAPIVSIDGGIRRSLGLTPVVAIVGALPLAALWSWGMSQRRVGLRVVGGLAIAVVIAAFGYINVREYFRTARSPFDDIVFAERFTDAVLYTSNRTDQPKVYLLSANFAWDHEVRRYLAPKIQGENRSKEFGQNQSLDVPPGQTALFLILPGYFDRIAVLEVLYPGGTTYTRQTNGDVWYIAFTVRPPLP